MEICDGQGFPFSPVVGKVWRIVPCVYKIYTLDRFQFHGLLKNNPIFVAGHEFFCPYRYQEGANPRSQVTSVQFMHE